MRSLNLCPFATILAGADLDCSLPPVNGVVPEKFDAVKLSHMVDAEYGNQGVDFKFVAREGFGWTNASFQVGVSFLTVAMRRAVSACVAPDVYFSRTGGQGQAGAGESLVDPIEVAARGLSL